MECIITGRKMILEWNWNFFALSSLAPVRNAWKFLLSLVFSSSPFPRIFGLVFILKLRRAQKSAAEGERMHRIEHLISYGGFQLLSLRCEGNRITRVWSFMKEFLLLLHTQIPLSDSIMELWFDFYIHRFSCGCVCTWAESNCCRCRMGIWTREKGRKGEKFVIFPFLQQ